MSTEGDGKDEKRGKGLTIPQTTERVVALNFSDCCNVNCEDFVEAHWGRLRRRER